MQVKIKVYPAARVPRIVEEERMIKVYVNAAAVDGKANIAVIKALATHYGVRKSKIEILKGHKSRLKTIEVNL